MRRIVSITLLMLPAPLLAQLPQPSAGPESSKATAKANATANSSDTSKSHSSQTVTHRVVVVNGKTVVDERTVDGKPSKSRRRGKVVPLPGAGLPPVLPPLDMDEMMRKLRERVEADVRRSSNKRAAEGRQAKVRRKPIPLKGKAAKAKRSIR